MELRSYFKAAFRRGGDSSDYRSGMTGWSRTAEKIAEDLQIPITPFLPEQDFRNGSKKTISKKKAPLWK